MRFLSIFVNLVLVGLAVVSDAAPGPTTTTPQDLAAPAAESVVLDKRYPVSYFNRTLDTPQRLCSDTSNLIMVASDLEHNVTLRDCEVLRDMYANNRGSDGNGYWDFTFSASDRDDTDGKPQFTVDFTGDCELKMGLLYYYEVPLEVKIGNNDVYNFINTAVSKGNFSRATGQVGCDGELQVVWSVEWIPGAIGR